MPTHTDPEYFFPVTQIVYIMCLNAHKGGEKRRLSLAMAMIKSPRVIILDEPTSGLDSGMFAHCTCICATYLLFSRVLCLLFADGSVGLWRC